MCECCLLEERVTAVECACVVYLSAPFRNVLQWAVMFIFLLQPLVGHNMLLDLMHLHDKFYRPLPGTAVCSCCPRLLPLRGGWNRRCSGHLPPQTPAGLSKQWGWLPLLSSKCWSASLPAVTSLSELLYDSIGFSPVS